MKLRLLTLCMFVSLVATGVHAAKPADWSEGEVALAGPYCIDTMGFKYGDSSHNTSPRAAHWVGLMGQGFWAMHHYCWAMVNMRRAQVTMMPASQRRYLIGSAIDDLNYVLKSTPPGFVMRPEVHLRIGDAQALLGVQAQAIVSYTAARNANPDYWPAYQRMAEVLLGLKQTEQARGMLREGLTRVPGSVVLQNLYKRVGGDPAEFVAAAQAAQAASAASAPAVPASAADATAPAASAPGAAPAN